MHLRPFTLRAGCSLPYFREWDLQILSPGSSPPSIFFHSWLSTLFCLLLIVTVLCRLLPALPPRHFCSSLALLPIISAPRASPCFTADAHQCGFSFHHPCHKFGPPYYLQNQKQEKAIWEKHFMLLISTNGNRRQHRRGFFQLNSHLWGGGQLSLDQSDTQMKNYVCTNHDMKMKTVRFL